MHEITDKSFAKISIFATLLFALACSCATPTAVSDTSELAQLCKGKPVKLNRISQVKALVEASEGTLSPEVQSSCEKFKGSIVGLAEILEAVQTGKSCNLEFVEKISNYHREFVASPDDKPKENIPLSLRQFFVSLCFQVSAECKSALINNLELDTKEKLNEDDFKAFELLERYGATFMSPESAPKDFDDIILIGDIKELSASDEDERHDIKLVVSKKTTEFIRKLIKTCQLRLKPFYSKLILPLIELSNLGYNYQGEMLKRELDELANNKLVHKWYNIVQTCESFNFFEVFEDKENLIGERQAITLITPEQADLLRQSQQPLNEVEIQKTQPLEYEPISGRKDDELWIMAQGELGTLIKRYKSSYDKKQRFKEMAIKKLFGTVKEFIFSGKVFVFALDSIKCSLKKDDGCNGSVSNINEDIVMMFEDAISQHEDETNPSIDNPVAFPAKAKRNKKSAKAPRKGVPPKATYLLGPVDETKVSNKVKGWLGGWLPSRMTITMWVLFFGSILAIVLAIILHAG